jgi:hypothetical protein
VTVLGGGFGAKPTNGVADTTLSNCSGIFSGTVYPDGELWFEDTTASFSGGAYSGGHLGNCIGLNIEAWAGGKVVFKLGNFYGTNTADLATGDGFAVSVKGEPGSTTVPKGI